MTSLYENLGVRFQYPADWQIEEDRTVEFVSVSVQGPGGAFFTLVIYEYPRDHKAMLDEAVQAIRDEFAEPDQRRAWQTLSGHRATGRDLSFYSLDLTNTCAIRAFSTDDRTFMVMYQATDADLPEVQPGFDRICESLRVDR